MKTTTTSIDINKMTVKELLEEGEKIPFIIPDYQRPYAWGEDEIETLFNDIWDFCILTRAEESKTYFLGCIVSYLNDDNEREIIDGQQRLISLTLLLRAIYSQLEEGSGKSEEVDNFKRQIEPTIWSKSIYSGKADFEQTHIKTKVLAQNSNSVLDDILKNGTTDQTDNNYFKNFEYFKKLLKKVSSRDPMIMYRFYHGILNQTILLPITANSQDSALTIFSTLNDRGLPLSDSDIFKAKLYNHYPQSKKESFIEEWENLIEITEQAELSLDKLFNIYMFVIKAYEENSDTTRKAIRKFFSENNFRNLYRENLLDDLIKISNFFLIVNKNIDNLDLAWSKNLNILKSLDILSEFPNDYWKYPVVTYLLSHSENPNFEKLFEKFLNRLIAELIIKYLISPNINAFKTDIAKLNIDIVNNPKPEIKFRNIDLNEAYSAFIKPNQKIIKMLLKLLSYNEGNEELLGNFQIEHILPKKYDTVYFADYPTETVDEYIENIGNLTPFERNLNIKASNYYINEKKKKYKESKFKLTCKLGHMPQQSWEIEDIKTRNNNLKNEFINIINNYKNNYTSDKSEIPNKLNNKKTKRKSKKQNKKKIITSSEPKFVSIENSFDIITGKKVVGYKFEGLEENTKHFADAYVEILKRMYIKDPMKFKEIIQKNKNFSLKNMFSDMDDLRASRKIAQNLYAETNTSSIKKIEILTLFKKLININELLLKF